MQHRCDLSSLLNGTFLSSPSVHPMPHTCSLALAKSLKKQKSPAETTKGSVCGWLMQQPRARGGVCLIRRADHSFPYATAGDVIVLWDTEVEWPMVGLTPLGHKLQQFSGSLHNQCALWHQLCSQFSIGWHEKKMTNDYTDGYRLIPQGSMMICRNSVHCSG